MKKNIPSSVALAAVLFVAFIVGMVVVRLLSSSTQIDADPVELNITDRTAQGEPAPSIPDDWAEHRNGEYGFVVSVPPDHELTSQYGEFGVAGTRFFVWPDGARESRWTIDIWDVSTWDQGGTAVEFIEDQRAFELRIQGPTYRETVEEARVGGISAVLITMTDNVHPDWVWKSTYLERDGKVIRIEDGARDDEEFDVFLASFEFID